MLTQTQLAAVWILCGAVAFFVLLVVIVMVMAAIDGPQPDRHSTDIGVIVMLAVLAALGLAGAATFARLYMLPARSNTLPRDIHLAPAW